MKITHKMFRKFYLGFILLVLPVALLAITGIIPYVEGEPAVWPFIYYAWATAGVSLFYGIYWGYTHFFRYKGKAYSENDTIF